MTDPAVPASARTVVLVHGAWHGAWCYAALQAELDRRGVPSLAVDLPGHGVSLAPLTDLHGDARCVADTLAMLGQRGVENPVLVGHSYGGAVITQAAVWFPAVAHLVYLAAFALDDGESVMGALRAFPRHDVALSAAMRPLDDGTSVLDPAVAGAALLVGGLLLTQFSLGIANVLLQLPLGVATAHNGVAALLLISLVYLNFRLWPPRS